MRWAHAGGRLPSRHQGVDLFLCFSSLRSTLLRQRDCAARHCVFFPFPALPLLAFKPQWHRPALSPEFVPRQLPKPLGPPRPPRPHNMATRTWRLPVLASTGRYGPRQRGHTRRWLAAATLSFTQGGGQPHKAADGAGPTPAPAPPNSRRQAVRRVYLPTRPTPRSARILPRDHSRRRRRDNRLRPNP